MQGNNTQSKSSFLKGLRGRRLQLAEMLIAGATMEVANEAGYNDIIVKEMARDIKKTVEGFENFQLGATAPVNVETTVTTEPGNVETPGGQLSANSEVPQNATQTDLPTEGTVTADQNATAETTVSTEPVDPAATTPAGEQSVPDQTVS